MIFHNYSEQHTMHILTCTRGFYTESKLICLKDGNI